MEGERRRILFIGFVVTRFISLSFVCYFRASLFVARSLSSAAGPARE